LKKETESSAYSEMLERAFVAVVVAALIVATVALNIALLSWAIFFFIIYGILYLSYKLSKVEKLLWQMEETIRRQTS